MLSFDAIIQLNRNRTTVALNSDRIRIGGCPCQKLHRHRRSLRWRAITDANMRPRELWNALCSPTLRTARHRVGMLHGQPTAARASLISSSFK
jgi:hypothetical protein